MGRATYEVGLKDGLTSPYDHLKQYVVSSTLTSPDPAVTVVDDPGALVRRSRSRTAWGSGCAEAASWRARSATRSTN
ncbi:hypothetical protein ABZX90_09790 [Streptomyces sp. NPDC002935]|uniref:hypothetical protein n=1 Tax=Streptomyces sp. NPDC002935 TaxID=3154545 RepID=UPI0033BAC201